MDCRYDGHFAELDQIDKIRMSTLSEAIKFKKRELIENWVNPCCICQICFEMDDEKVQDKSLSFNRNSFWGGSQCV